MLDVLESLIDLHLLFREGFHVPTSDIGNDSTVVKQVDIGLHPQHPYGFVELITVIYGTRKAFGGFLLQDPILLPSADNDLRLFRLNEKYNDQVDSRLRVGATSISQHKPLLLYANIVGKSK